MKKTRIGALLLVVAMVATMFAGCKAKKNVMLTIDGKEFPSYLVEYFVYSMANSYQSQGANLADYLDQEISEGTTLESALKSQIVDQLKYYAAWEKMAEENGLTLTKDELKQIEETKKQQIEEAGGRKEFVNQLKEAKIQEEAIDDMQKYGKLQEKVFSGLFSTGGKFAPSTEDVVSKVIPDNIRVKHILVMATEGDEDFEEKRKKAQDIQTRAAGGEDFEALLTEFGEDPGMESNTEGYIFDNTGANFDGNGTMNTQFTEASFKLEVNQISPIVESPNGFHIIKRLPLDEAYITEHLETFSSVVAYDVFQQKTQEVAEGLTVVETDAFKNFSIKALLGGSDSNSGTTGTTGGTTGTTGTTGGSTGTTGGADSGSTGTTDGSTGATDNGTTGSTDNSGTGGTTPAQ